VGSASYEVHLIEWCVYWEEGRLSSH